MLVSGCMRFVLMLLGVQHSVRVVCRVSCCVFGVLIFRYSLTFVIFGFGNVFADRRSSNRFSGLVVHLHCDVQLLLHV
jgi:hypothetical protein